MVFPTENFHGTNTIFARRQKIWLIHTLKRDLQNSSPFWPTENPNVVPQPSASASALLWKGLRHPLWLTPPLRCPDSTCITLEGFLLPLRCSPRGSG